MVSRQVRMQDLYDSGDKHLRRLGSLGKLPIVMTQYMSEMVRLQLGTPGRNI